MLRTVATDDVINVRGIVQEIRLRTIVEIVPAVLVFAATKQEAKTLDVDLHTIPFVSSER